MRLVPAVCGILMLLTACSAPRPLPGVQRGHSAMLMTAEAFFIDAASLGVHERDSAAAALIRLQGMPRAAAKWARIRVQCTDSTTGKKLRLSYWVSSDYLSLGTNRNHARIPLTPMTAQSLLDAWQASLPTRKMVDDIYRSARVKLTPVPLYAFRDSTPTLYHHHLIIEGQRQGRRGLIAGIKKDVVSTARLYNTDRPNRVAIYGWHRPDGRPIQPLYTGHVNWYVDYSHGIRAVSNHMRLNGRRILYADVLAHPVYSRLLCDEEDCRPYRYPAGWNR